jgi:hypothetical protein
MPLILTPSTVLSVVSLLLLPSWLSKRLAVCFLVAGLDDAKRDDARFLSQYAFSPYSGGVCDEYPAVHEMIGLGKI